MPLPARREARPGRRALPAGLPLRRPPATGRGAARSPGPLRRCPWAASGSDGTRRIKRMCYKHGVSAFAIIPCGDLETI